MHPILCNSIRYFQLCYIIGISTFLLPAQGIDPLISQSIRHASTAFVLENKHVFNNLLSDMAKQTELHDNMYLDDLWEEKIKPLGKFEALNVVEEEYFVEAHLEEIRIVHEAFFEKGMRRMSYILSAEGRIESFYVE